MTQAVRKMACFHFFQEKSIFYIVTQIVFWKKLLIRMYQDVKILKPQLPNYLNFMKFIVIGFGNPWKFFTEFFNENIFFIKTKEYKILQDFYEFRIWIFLTLRIWPKDLIYLMQHDTKSSEHRGDLFTI